MGIVFIVINMLLTNTLYYMNYKAPNRVYDV